MSDVQILADLASCALEDGLSNMDALANLANSIHGTKVTIEQREQAATLLQNATDAAGAAYKLLQMLTTSQVEAVDDTEDAEDTEDDVKSAPAEDDGAAA